MLRYSHIYFTCSLCPKMLRNIRLFHAKRDKKYAILHNTSLHGTNQRFPDISGRSASGKEISMSGVEIEVEVHVQQSYSPPDKYSAEDMEKRPYSRLSAMQQPMTPSTESDFHQHIMLSKGSVSHDDLASGHNETVEIMQEAESTDDIKKMYRRST